MLSNTEQRQGGELISSLVLSNWKNGALVSKENKFRNLAVLLLSAELALAVIGSFALSLQVRIFHGT